MAFDIKKIYFWAEKVYFWLTGMVVLLFGWNFFSHTSPYIDVLLIIASGLLVYFFPPVNRIEKCFYTLFLIFWMLIWVLGTGISLFYRARRSFSVEDITLIIAADWCEVAEFFKDLSVITGAGAMIVVAGILFPAVQRGTPYGVPLLKY